MERGQRRDGGLVADLAVCEADHAQTLFGEAGVAGTVVLERLATTWRSPVVDLDDKAVVSPEEVDAMGADLNVGFRLGQPAAAAQGEKLPLQVAVHAIRNGLAERIAAELGLAGRSAHLLRRGDGGEVGEGSGDVGHGDDVAGGGHGSCERARAVQVEPGTFAAARRPNDSQ